MRSENERGKAVAVVRHSEMMTRSKQLSIELLLLLLGFTFGLTMTDAQGGTGSNLLLQTTITPPIIGTKLPATMGMPLALA